MGVNMPNHKFLPNDVVTRAQAVTIFDRMLPGGKERNDANPYWKKHMEYLHEKGIISVTDPNLVEKRAFLAAIMKRLVDNGLVSKTGEAKVNCDSMEVMLTCTLDPDNCPAECKAEEGTGNVETGANNTGNTCEEGYVWDDVANQCVVEKKGVLTVEKDPSTPLSD